MRPTLRQLEYVVTVAETGQIGLAAKQLNVSQPSLSAQLQEVETDLGVVLFLRGRAGARMTPAGEEVVRRARQILQQHQDLKAIARGGGLFQGRLRLGVLPSLGPYLLPGVVRRLHSEHPSLRLIVREESTRDLDEGLRSGRFDMIISTPEAHTGFNQVRLFEEPMWCAVALDDPMATAQSPIALSRFRERVFLTLGARHRLSSVVENLATSVGGHVSDEYEGTSLDAIRLMAASGAGVAILPSIYARTEARRGTDVVLLEIADKAARREIALIEGALPISQEESSALAEILTSEARAILS